MAYMLTQNSINQHASIWNILSKDSTNLAQHLKLGSKSLI